MTPQHSRQIERLYQLMYPRMFVYARSTLSSDSLAEEAVQETFRIACQKPEELCTSPCPEGWLITTLKYVISNMIRNRATANRILGEYLAAHARELAVCEDRLDFGTLYQNVADLEEYQLIRELAVEGLSHLEMAQKRGISLDACKKRVQRAKDVPFSLKHVDGTKGTDPGLIPLHRCQIVCVP